MLQVVWFKRDLRTADHVALASALTAGPVLCLYVVEPEYWQLPDTSNRQWLFARESLLDLHRDLTSFGGQLHCHRGNVIDVLTQIKCEHGEFVLHSHEETGNLWTYQRDKNVKRWCKHNAITWQEYPQFGVVRGHTNRNQWSSQWQAMMAQPLHTLPVTKRFFQLRLTLAIDHLPYSVSEDPIPCVGRQLGGRSRAIGVMKSFLTWRGEAYRGSISSPITAESACSRLSPYLAYGCISMKELYRALKQVQSRSSGRWRASLASFESRLWWHCHFMQKLEDEPTMEINNLHPASDYLHRELTPEFFLAWQQGRTGWPMVDACMRYLHHHGWINFRMRAMLVSIASFPLWLPWQPVSHWLASLFVDYEPGIHYPQIQMQAGTTGINIPRMYNPITQAQKCDPEGKFVRQWVPELQHVSDQWIFEPWHMGQKQQQNFGVIIGEDYPAPLVDFAQATRLARERMKNLNTHEYRRVAKGIGQKHGSRKRQPTHNRKQKPPPKNDQQLTLF